jgi:hypothetical protein
MRVLVDGEGTVIEGKLLEGRSRVTLRVTMILRMSSLCAATTTSAS